MDFSHISDALAAIPVSTIFVAATILTLIRLVLTRFDVPVARGLSELVEAALIAVVLVFMVIQPFIMKSFFIPSPSMVPTLVEDDHIVCNKFAYRIGQPHHGDIIVFVAPDRALRQAPEGFHPDQGPVDYIKRLIGLPGDVIEVRHGYVAVNGDQKTHANLRAVFGVLGDTGHEHVKIEKSDIAVYNGQWTRYDAQQVAAQFGEPGAKVEFHPGETIRNGAALNEPYTAEDPEYDMKIVDGNSVLSYPDDGGEPLVDGQEPAAGQFRDITAAKPGPVPPGFVFAMGDNRNDSGDSTHWGPLERNRLVGKADLIFWPFGRVRELH